MTFIHTTPWAYYNDFDEKTCDWLEELIRRDAIAPGVVDRRSILEVQPDDLREFRQVHFFAGIGGWSYALRLMGWPDDEHVWTGSPPCFPSGVLVTTRRGIIPIEEVRVGDECLTHLGNWKPVVRIGNALKPVVELVGHGHFGLVTTHDHPFWARTRNIIKTRRNSRSFQKHVIGDAYWQKASGMEGCWWAMPRSIVVDLPTMPTNYSHEELAMLCGLYVGDGWVAKGHEAGSLILGVNESKAREIKTALPKVSFSHQKTRTGVRLVLRDREIGAFLREHFGEGSLSKTIPLWMMSAPDQMRCAFLVGWDLTDGTRTPHSGSRRITTASRKLAITGRMLLVSMGFAASIRKIKTADEQVIEGRTVSQADYYTLNRSMCDRYRFHDDTHTWFKVKSVTDRGEKARVYDLEVADDHSYVADGIVVHNCQPFSSAGRQKGKEDERHLAPKFASLVWACRPRVLFGEQVASADVFGKAPKKPRRGAAEPPQWAWLDDLLDRLEAAHYAVGANDLPSASIGAPHIRQRTHFGAVNLEWLADAQRGEWGSGSIRGLRQADGAQGQRQTAEFAGSGDGHWLADRLSARLEGHRRHGDDRDEPGRVGTDTPRSASARNDFGGMAHTDSGESGQRGRTGRSEGEGLQCGAGTDGRGMSGGVAHTEHHDGRSDLAQRGSQRRASDARAGATVSLDDRGWTGTADSPWETADWLFCRDGKWRPVEARAQQMVDGLPVDLGRGGDPGEDEGSWGRIAESLAQEEIGFPLGKVEYARATRLRGYGNAINPHLAAEFIVAFLDALRGCADELSGQSPLEGFSVRQRDMEELL